MNRRKRGIEVYASQLVVDTGIGPANGEIVRAEAWRLGGNRRNT